MSPRGWRPDYTATFARASSSLLSYMRSHDRPCLYCSGTGTIFERAEFRGGRLFPVACKWCNGSGKRK